MSARVRSVELIPAAGEAPAEVRVSLEGGGLSAFAAATPGEASRWTAEGRDFSFGTPLLFVSRLESRSVEEAVAAMSDEMSGYWLRYYNSPGGPLRAPASRRASPRKARKRA